MRRDVEALLKYKFVKNVVQDLTSGGIDWQREKWQSGFGSKFIRQGEKNAVKYADESLFVNIIARSHRRFARHDLRDKLLFILKGLIEVGVKC